MPKDKRKLIDPASPLFFGGQRPFCLLLQQNAFLQHGPLPTKEPESCVGFGFWVTFLLSI